MKIALLLPLLLGTAAPGVPLPVHIGGRVVAEPGGALRFGWPGVYFEGRFRGTAVTVRAETGAEPLRVLLDGKPAGEIAAGETALVLRGLPAGEHLVRLEKVTESQHGSARFLGFFAEGKALAPRARAGQIEFIGDSYTVGYGNVSPTRECTTQAVHDATDTQRAFGPVLARRLGADYRIVAYSGYGVVRNYAGHDPGKSLPALYGRGIPAEPQSLAKPAAWKPRVIVINLGTNDFSTELKPGEAWADPTALRAAYRTRYIVFVRELQAQQPQARLVLMGSDAFIGEVEAVATATGATAVRFGGLELTGCHSHPSAKDDAQMADLLAGVVGTP